MQASGVTVVIFCIINKSTVLFRANSASLVTKQKKQNKQKKTNLKVSCEIKNIKFVTCHIPICPQKLFPHVSNSQTVNWEKQLPMFM